MATENMEFRGFYVRQLCNWPRWLPTNRPKNTCLCSATGFHPYIAGPKRFTSSGRHYIIPADT
jgi:hypothetical protein